MMSSKSVTTDRNFPDVHKLKTLFPHDKIKTILGFKSCLQNLSLYY